MASKRQNPRTFFYEGLPAVLFFIGGNVYSGFITDKSRSGLGLVTSDTFVDAQAGDIISRMYIGKPEDEFAIESLKLIHLRHDIGGKRVFLGVHADTKELEDRLDHVMRLITEDKTQPVKECQPDKFPFFGGKDHYSEKAIKTRLKWLSDVTGVKMKEVPRSTMKPISLAGNIENYVGVVQIPVGIAGPILVKGTYTDSYVPIPIGTIEGALVSSLSRGAKVCNMAGGVRVQVTRQTMLRAPVFFCRNMPGAVNLQRWIRNHMTEIMEKAVSVSSVAQLTGIDTFLFGNTLHLSFYYSTGDAAGQNMTTACTWYACEWIAEQVQGDNSIEFDHYMIEGNMSGDKKLNYQNFIKGRGISVIAEAVIPESILQRLLRVSARDIADGWWAAEAGATQIGMIGSNVNYANVIAGIFAATGQDMASIHESSAGLIKFIEDEGALRIHAYLPSLVIGTVGGGTNLPTQRENLEIMGCSGQGKVFRLAEIIAASCLALDLSTAAAIATNEFVAAHERLGRNRPDKALSKSKINARFFTDLFDRSDIHVFKAEEIPIEDHQGIVSTILDKKRSGVKGIFKYGLKIRTPEDVEEKSVILKLKSSDTEIINIGLGLARLSGHDRLPGLFEANLHIFGFNNCHQREIEFYRNTPEELKQFCPHVYGTKEDPSHDIFAVLMEDLSPLSHFDTVDTPEQWDNEAITAALNGLADIHAVYFNKFDAIPKSVQANVFDPDALLQSMEFIEILTRFNAQRFPELISTETHQAYSEFLASAAIPYEQMLRFPKTLTHNDFSPRNLCLRDTDKGKRLVVYDWELPCFQNPQKDLVEFLIFALPAEQFDEAYRQYTHYYCYQLEKRVGQKFMHDTFFTVLHYNALDLATIRFNLYLLAHNILKFPFMERVYANLTRVIHNPPQSA